MREPAQNTTKLPRQLLAELGVPENDSNSFKGKRRVPRKELRKAARVQKKQSGLPGNKTHIQGQQSNDDYERAQSRSQRDVLQPKVSAPSVQPKPAKSILKTAKPQRVEPDEEVTYPRESLSPTPLPRISRSTQLKLAEDDAKIAALEKVLGVKGKKKLPKTFEEDGLDSLLDGLDDAVDSNETKSEKRKRGEQEEWLKEKRQKVQRGVDAVAEEVNCNSDSELEECLNDGETSSSADLVNFNGFDFSDGEHAQLPQKGLTDRVRENPYIAPVARSDTFESNKYVPPSIRNKSSTGREDLSQLRRQLQGLLNRLSEANLTSILGDVEKIYQANPRQHVTATLLDLLLEMLSDPSQLQETFIILHAGFISALYKIIGTDFGAQAVHRIDEDFKQNYKVHVVEEAAGKKLANLASLLSQLYNFQVIGSNLIHDYIRFCLVELSEINIELLLKIIRNAGQQLRQHDPSSLKDIIVQIQNTTAKVGEKNLSVRAKFMIETINDLKNNRTKTGVAASMITSEHTIRMKKTLGSLNNRNLKGTEPLRIGAKDLRDRDKIGTWWLVGASYKGGVPEQDDSIPAREAGRQIGEEGSHLDRSATDLVNLAKEQGMNTDVRRSIFISVMSSTDYNDAYVRLMKLRLKKAQRIEIPKVLIHCAGGEKAYNPFYTYLSRRICSDKKLKMSYQFCLWDLFKQMGEGTDEGDKRRDENGNGNLELRSLVNIAKMFGVLIAEGGLSLDVLKILNFVYLQPKTQTFVEILLITTVIHSQQDGDYHNKKLLDVFLKPKQISGMAGGLRYFLKKVVSKTDVASNNSEKDTIKRGCKIVGDALKNSIAQTVAVD